ncbi:cuticle protein 18.6 [Lepeophtheirus salmonis]|uniref:cuticle protein 18.6 n=1 Tax=Lepeophtheirus salmonis TaxID=72036 RepID=UPI001AE56274|nr:cuticle protein 18.6-like [Lepeophtheirus salmonis]
MSTKCIIALSCLFALASGAPQYNQASYSGGGGGGASQSLEPYNYQYSVQDPESGNDFSAQESSDGQVVSGSYRVALPDGRIQVVNYRVEGDSGFVADVSYEGTPSYSNDVPQPRYV